VELIIQIIILQLKSIHQQIFPINIASPIDQFIQFKSLSPSIAQRLLSSSDYVGGRLNYITTCIKRLSNCSENDIIFLLEAGALIVDPKHTSSALSGSMLDNKDRESSLMAVYCYNAAY
jgi:hypothetical protein